MKLEKAIDGFIYSIGSNGYSTITMRYYRQDMERLSEFLENPHVEDITENDLRKYFDALRARKLCENSVQVHWKVFRSFFNWAENEMRIERPDKSIPQPETTIPAIAPFSQDEVSKLMRAAKTRRHKAIIVTLLDTGIRVSELARMVLKDVDLSNSRMVVRPFQTGKKSRSRIIPLGRTANREIWRYLSSRDDTEDQTAPLIATHEGKFMNRHMIRQLLVRISSNAGVSNCFPHRFRHTFAIEYLRNGGDIFTLQEILGHASMAMVRRYLDIADADIENAHRRASPADRWRL